MTTTLTDSLPPVPAGDWRSRIVRSGGPASGWGRGWVLLNVNADTEAEAEARALAFLTKNYEDGFERAIFRGWRRPGRASVKVETKAEMY